MGHDPVTRIIVCAPDPIRPLVLSEFLSQRERSLPIGMDRVWAVQDIAPLLSGVDRCVVVVSITDKSGMMDVLNFLKQVGPRIAQDRLRVVVMNRLEHLKITLLLLSKGASEVIGFGANLKTLNFKLQIQLNWLQHSDEIVKPNERELTLIHGGQLADDEDTFWPVSANSVHAYENLELKVELSGKNGAPFTTPQSAEFLELREKEVILDVPSGVFTRGDELQLDARLLAGDQTTKYRMSGLIERLDPAAKNRQIALCAVSDEIERSFQNVIDVFEAKRARMMAFFMKAKGE